MTGSIGTDGRPIEVLLVEDSPGDLRLAQEAFSDVKGPIKLHMVCDGVEAMRFLRGEGVHALNPRPDLTLLDLNLAPDGWPRGSCPYQGRRSEHDSHRHPQHVGIGVDSVKSYLLQANCHLCKPVRLEAFEAQVKSINDFRLTTVHLPPKK